MLLERKTRLEATIAALVKDRQGLVGTLDARALTSEQIQSVEEFAREVEQVFILLDETNFDAKRAMIDRLDIQVRLAIEDNERIAYLSSPIVGAEVLSITYKPSNTPAPTPTRFRNRPAGAG